MMYLDNFNEKLMSFYKIFANNLELLNYQIDNCYCVDTSLQRQSNYRSTNAHLRRRD